MAIDPSPLGSGGVVFINRKLVDYWFTSEANGVAAKYPDRCILVPKMEGENSRIERVRVGWRKARDMTRKYRPDLIGLEDYVYVASTSTIQIAELGGVLRMGLSEMAPVRTWPPDSVKKARTGSFKATKEDMIEMAVEELMADGSELAVEIMNISKRTGTLKGQKYLEAVSDALAIRELTQYEIDYRVGIVRGETPLSKWPRQVVTVFHRVTKQVPCVLDRSFLFNGVKDGI